MSCKVAVVGAGGILGRSLITALKDRSFPFSQLRLFDERHAVGTVDDGIVVEEISEHALKTGGFSYVFFAAGARVTEMYSPCLESGTIIDLSSHYRGFSSVPLVVPEINGPESFGKKIIACPDSLGVQLALSLSPISDIFPVDRVLVSTYQSVSGSGGQGIEELERQVNDISQGKEAHVRYFPKQIAYNVFPQVDVFGEDGWSKAEERLADETRRVLHLPNLQLAATCVRVPVLRGHAMNVTLTLGAVADVERILKEWRQFRPLSVYEDDNYPTPWDLEDSDKVGVGRLRKDPYLDNVVHYWCVADNLTRDTALNAILLVEMLYENMRNH
ncbi:MAG: aspartate-semialdehyde dehydrogenase [Brevinema sp.]